MAEEKHRMLFQDQDPGQDLQIERPMSLSPSEPPTYYDAMQTFTIQNNLIIPTIGEEPFLQNPNI